MSDPTSAPTALDDEAVTDTTRFDWHPQYRGRTVGEVRAELTDELRSDQKSYALAIDGPEENEGQILVRVVGLERRWGPYAMDWAGADIATVVDRAVAFEVARDRARELFPYGRYRDALAPTRSAVGAGTASGSAGATAPWWAFWRR